MIECRMGVEGVKNSIETERKYIIRMPDIEDLSAQSAFSVSQITQIYLTSPMRITNRVRKREYKDKTVYTQTKKIRIDKISAHEDEREISENEYYSLIENIKQGTSPIIKTRYTFEYLGQIFEIDVYPGWKKTAIMETELDDRYKEVVMPPFIKIIREVTGVKGYSNAAMSLSFPKEDEIE